MIIDKAGCIGRNPRLAATGKAARRLAMGMLLALMSPAAHACTLCHTAEARELRHQVFQHGFRENLLSISVVLPILLGMIWLAGMERAGPTRRRQ